MIDEKKIELMKKLQRLAERGVGGEKEGAQKKLQQLMKKYNIEESDLSLAGILYHTEAQQQQCSEVVTKQKK